VNWVQRDENDEYTVPKLDERTGDYASYELDSWSRCSQIIAAR